MRRVGRLVQRFWLLILLVGLFVLLQVGFVYLPRIGLTRAASSARQGSATMVYTSTSVAKPVFVSTSVMRQTAAATPAEEVTLTASPTVSQTPSPTSSVTPSPSPTVVTSTPTSTPTRAVAGEDTSAVETSITSTGRLTPTLLLTATAVVSPTETPSATPSPTWTSTPTPLPLPTPDGVARTARVPILMYHYLSVPPADADIYRKDLSVTPDNFEAQLAWYRSQGYEGITLDELVRHLTLGAPLPEKPIVLTFDDGYRDAYTNAFPLLKQYGFPGTFFLVTRRIDEGNPDYLTWDMVVEMHAAGMSMQPHGYTHADLRGKSVDFLVYEIVGAKEAIEARTGETARFFCYPSGSYDGLTIDVLRSANFWAATTTQQGATHSNKDLFELSRIRMRGNQSLEDIDELLTARW
jgi:peptidoglycan/xylan/chitin deacetylase (PgdA/CDA1 family)